MPHHPLFVLADDLTGAAEIAGIAHQAGFRAIVHTTLPAGRLDGDVIVINTDTRLLPPSRAARRVRDIAQHLRSRANSGFFKKTDSVLRGPVLAEIEAGMTALGFERALLVPCNPSLGRVIRDGRYHLGGQPLHKTAFARDPHHPRTTADVCALLTGAETREASRNMARQRLTVRARRDATSERVICCSPATRLPRMGVIVGEADTPADVSYWAGQIDRQTLPAGGADFFRAFLHMRGARVLVAPPPPLPQGGTLLLSGTATPPVPVSPLPGRLVEVSARRIPTAIEITAAAGAQLHEVGFASVVMRGALARDPAAPAILNRLFAGVGRRLHAARAFRHLLATGGATASIVLDELGWTKLEVTRVWGPGVVTLRPVTAPGFAITVKPGSYAWPSRLSRHFDGIASLETAAR